MDQDIERKSEVKNQMKILEKSRRDEAILTAAARLLKCRIDEVPDKIRKKLKRVEELERKA